MPATYPAGVIVAILVAAGSGSRLGAGVPKALVEVAGAPLLAWSVRALDGCARIEGIVVTAPAGYEDVIRAAIPSSRAAVTVVTGGASRQRSVGEGLRAMSAQATAVVVHDAARPLVTAQRVDAVIDALADADGAIAASPVVDTLKRGDEESLIVATVERAGVWRAETPQCFHAGIIRAAFVSATDEELDTATDCSSMVQARGGRVRLVASDEPNLKVTTPADVTIVAALLRDRSRWGPSSQ